MIGLMRMFAAKRFQVRGVTFFLLFFMLSGWIAGCGLDGSRGRGAGSVTEESGETRPVLKSERFLMTAVDASDQDFTDGKDYFFSMFPEQIGDGSIRYRFAFKLGTRSVTGDPATEQTLTIG